MITKVKRRKAAIELTQDERVSRLRSLFGKYKGLTGGTKEFQKYKTEEIDLEEERDARRLRHKK